jgi:proteasome assembly chaperone (PAC2) family protein
MTTKSSGRRVFACRVAVETPAIVEEIAKDLGCLRVNGNGEIVGAAGVLLDGIADGRFMLVLREP